jgi:hypothetical protein
MHERGKQRMICRGPAAVVPVEKKQKKSFTQNHSHQFCTHPKKLRERERELAVSSHLSLYLLLYSLEE